MSFRFFYTFKNLLFENLDVSCVGSFVGACIVLLIISFLYEVIRFLREYLNYQLEKTCCQSPVETSRLWPSTQTMTRSVKIQIHCSQTVLHLFQVIIGYILMLCVMTYNVWFLICVVFAMGLGHFLLGAILPKKFDPVEETCVSPLKPNGERCYSTMGETSREQKSTSQ